MSDCYLLVYILIHLNHKSQQSKYFIIREFLANEPLLPSPLFDSIKTICHLTSTPVRNTSNKQQN